MMAHHESRMANMKDPSKGFAKHVGWLDDTWAVVELDLL